MILSLLQTVSIWIFIISYFIIALFLYRSSSKSNEGRKNSFSWVFILNMIFLYAVLVAVYFLFSNLQLDNRDFLTLYGLLTISTYVGTIEIPGFLTLSRYDSTSIELLKDAKKYLVECVSSFAGSISHLEDLLSKNESRLEELHLYEQLNYFVASSKNMRQVNKPIFNLLLLEIQQTIKSTSEQSKHPFPKMIDIFSLAGLSFLIAQLLK